jgi:CHASE2 domain-containing sensor protein
MNANKPHLRRKIFRDLTVGIIAIGFLLCVKLYIETSYIGRWFTASGYDLLHSFIPPFDLRKEPSIVVLDISNLKRDIDGATPVQTLEDLIDALIASKAKAIAIDINFSSRLDLITPTKTGPRSTGDSAFFDFLHQKKTTAQVPLFVGVYPTGVESKTWLGSKNNADLAADMTLFDDTMQVPMWLRCVGTEKLNSLSMALAGAFGNKSTPTFLIQGLVEDPEAHENLKPILKEDNNHRQVPCERAFTFVNYSKLDLIQRLTIQASGQDSIMRSVNEERHSRFENKLVIIGNTQRDEAPHFALMGRQRPVAGTYIQAAAVYTLVEEPVYKFKQWAAICLDIALGLGVVIGVCRIRARHWADARFPAHRWETRFILFALLITVSLGVLLVRVFNILWLDFVLVISALLLHSIIQECVRWIPRIFGRAYMDDSFC